jgi:uncharacterized phage protein (TIGR01671 family)
MDNRVVKFRVWDKSMNRWWCEDSQYLQMDGKKIHPAPWSTLSADLPDENIIIQQWICKTDKNGVDIYEGDIVRFDEPRKLCEDVYMASLYVFDFYEGSFLNPYIYNSINGSKFVKREKNSLSPVGRAKLDRNPHFDWTKAEICGNVYENQDLIDL